MGRRSVYIRIPCAHEGCKETSRWCFDSRTAYLRSFEFKHYGQGNKPYYCCKHNPKHTLLSPEVRKSEWISPTSAPHEGCAATDRFFGGCGIVHGPGFWADAEDFPIGTRIKVTAEVILPDETR